MAKKKVNVTSNKKFFYVLLLFIATIFMGIGYASVNGVLVNIDGVATVLTQDVVHITSAVYSSDNDADLEHSSMDGFSATTLQNTITLGNSSSSTITYQVTIYNETNDNYIYTGVSYSAPEFYTNTNIIPEVTGMSVGYELNSKATKTFYVTFKYAGSNTSNPELSSYISFDFEKYYTITYQNINTSGHNYPTYILESETTKTINFSTDTPYDVSITPNVSHTYNYNDNNNDIDSDDTGTLVLSNVSTNITINRYYKIKYYLDGGSNPNGQPNKYIHGANVTILDATKTNYTFDGWYDNSGFTGNAITNTNGLSGNLVLYAKWLGSSSTNAATYIVGLTNGASNTSTNIINVSSPDNSCTNTFAYDGTTDKNLRYIGANPCNYVTFSGKIWRIVGVFNNIEISGQSEKETLVKLILDENYLDTKWDTSNKNIWQNSSLYNNLNGTFYPNILNSSSYVTNAIWNLGTGTSAYATSAVNYYTYERSNTPVSGGTSTTAGYVGLLYPSDFGFATSGVSDVTQSSASQDRISCINSSLSSSDWDRDTDPCVENDWLFFGDYMWTIMPRYNYSNQVWRMRDYGGIQNVTTNGYSCKVRPVIYLNSNVKIKTSVGNGSSSIPYELE